MYKKITEREKVVKRQPSVLPRDRQKKKKVNAVKHVSPKQVRLMFKMSAAQLSSQTADTFRGPLTHSLSECQSSSLLPLRADHSLDAVCISVAEVIQPAANRTLSRAHNVVLTELNSPSALNLHVL